MLKPRIFVMPWPLKLYTPPRARDYRAKSSKVRWRIRRQLRRQAENRLTANQRLWRELDAKSQCLFGPGGVVYATPRVAAELRDAAGCSRTTA